MNSADRQFDFDNSYRRLPAHFYAEIAPSPVPAPRLVAFNEPLARQLGLRLRAEDPALPEIFAGNRLPPGAQPIAMAYAGHQFGHFVPQLGDGRAVLLGEVLDRGGRRFDIQLKGAGRTPFSRGGDGRAPLGPALREYLVSEAMHALGVPTTRALALVTSGESVYRDIPLPGAVLTRVAAGHVRVGTFEYLAARGDWEGVRRLADYVIERHHPHAAQSEQPYRSLLAAVVEWQARLIARWMQIGFVHGVMNTDNMAVSGETIDFGPCAFLDAYVPDRAFSSIDRGNRYAYSNQPRIAQWDLARFAETLLPLLHDEEQRAVEQARELVTGFAARYQHHWLRGMAQKIGIPRPEREDAELVRDLLQRMQEGGADFTLTFRRLCDAAEHSQALAEVAQLFAVPEAFDEWAQRWLERVAREAESPVQRAAAMRRVNPLYIPRNHRVEQAIRAAVQHDDFGPFDTLREVLSQPFASQAGRQEFAQGPRPQECVYRTFCGT